MVHIGQRTIAVAWLFLLALATSCDDLPENIVSNISINISTPSDKSELEATAQLHLKATINSVDELKQYFIQVLSAADSSELYSLAQVASGKSIDISETIELLLDTEDELILKIEATDVNSKTAERKITVTKKAIPGYDERLGLAVSMVHYAKKPVNDNSRMESEFVLTNYGGVSYKKGDILYVNSTFNGQYFDLRLIPGFTTELKLHKDLSKGDTLHFNPGYVDAKAMLATNLPGIYQASELKLCILVWGTTESSVQHHNPNATLCEACGTYKP